MTMVREVQSDVAKNGTVSIDEALAEVDRIIDEAEQSCTARET